MTIRPAVLVRPSFDNYRKVLDYCRTLAGHRKAEEFHLLFLNRKNVLLADRMAPSAHGQPRSGLAA